MIGYNSFKFRDHTDSPDYFLWQVYTEWQKGKNEIIAEYNITSAQMTLMTAIYWVIQSGHDNMQAIVANAAKMDKMTTSEVLKTLQKKGLVRRKKHALDTRAKVVELTEQGLEITVKALRKVNKYNINYFSALGDSKAEFIATLQKLLNINTHEN